MNYHYEKLRLPGGEKFWLVIVDHADGYSQWYALADDGSFPPKINGLEGQDQFTYVHRWEQDALARGQMSMYRGGAEAERAAWRVLGRDIVGDEN